MEVMGLMLGEFVDEYTVRVKKFNEDRIFMETNI